MHTIIEGIHALGLLFVNEANSLQSGYHILEMKLKEDALKIPNLKF